MSELRQIQELVWNGSIPIEIRLASRDCRVFDQAEPFLISFPRLSYLPLLFTRLHSFFGPYLIDPLFSPSSSWLAFEDVPLKWHYPVGLLYDLYAGSSAFDASTNTSHGMIKPWRLILHYSEFPHDQLIELDAEDKVFHDMWINSVKEADYLRNGKADAIMKLSKDDSTSMWNAVQQHDMSRYLAVQNKLMPSMGAPLRHIPMRVFLPSPPTEGDSQLFHLNVMQTLVTSRVPPDNRERQTLGQALNGMLPSLFPSRRITVFAKPVLHGSVVPLNAELEGLLRTSAYLDGWLHIALELIG